MTDAFTATEGPILAGALAPQARSFFRRLRRRRHAFAGIPAQAYAEPVFQQRTLLGRLVWINDPQALKHVLVDAVANYPKSKLERRFFVAVFGEGLLGSEGDTWRTHRRIMAPAFDPRSVAAYAPAIADAAQDLAAAWAGLPAGAVLDVAAEMTRLTLWITAQTLFSADSPGLAALVQETVSRLQAALAVNLLDLLPVTGPIRARSRDAKMRRISRPLDDALGALIASRRRTPRGAPADLLGRLIAAEDPEAGSVMTPREVGDQVLTIFVAGHETTAAATSWIWYLLARHPAVEAKLHEELDTVLAGRPPGAADLAELKYTRMVVEEAMRLYPPAPGLSSRETVAADTICGVKAPAGSLIQISTWLLHRNPRIWDQPERFDPERFTPDAAARRPRHAYLPFGAGPRVCIGASLAMTETILIVATLAQRHRLSIVPDQTVELQARITLRPRDGLKMILAPRPPKP